ncbi:Lipase maturation factor 1 [Babesia bigemina]|uniref:Lipase maturation factor 1 n=1 Tax=Babesia bigemina TaxID=5866 RepID=A0A061DCF2_BABBI|nr:Lipase maturation factor 1 [Babesia bigemina]CDR95520.1 Lipase maturation factor 1 [Babesia bigemina]|eukprot:XP_012767706.1 Lipase maturation factor 1 [Babesia bigemina]
MALVRRDSADEPRVYSLGSGDVSPYTACNYEYPADQQADLLIARQEAESAKENSYNICRGIFLRALACVYFLSFLGHFNQDVGLIGQDGVWPAVVHMADLASSKRGVFLPDVSAFLPICDTCIRVIPIVGMALSLLVGVTGMASVALCLMLWFCKLALIALRSTLPTHNADLLLLEAGFIAIFLLSPFSLLEKPDKHWEVPMACRWAYRLLVYRIMFCSGLSKIRGSAHWADGTAFKYLLLDVPLPNPLTHLFFNLLDAQPLLNAFATNALLFVECVASIFLLVSARACRVVGGCVALNYALFMNCIGNFGTFYMLLGACTLFCFDDATLQTLWKNSFHKIWKLYKDDEGDEVAPVSPLQQVSDDVEEQSSDQEANETFGSKLVNAVTYRAKKKYIRDALFSNDSFGMTWTQEQHIYTQRIIQLVIVFITAIVAANIVIGRSNVGLKALLIFCLALIIHVQCDSIGTHEIYITAAGTLFALHMWLVLEFMTAGFSVWSFWLWIGVTELQLGLCHTKRKLYTMCSYILQSVIALVICCYAMPLLIRSAKYNSAVAGIKAPLGIVNSYDGFGVLPDQRYELVVQGTDEPVVTAATKWKQYELPCAPGDTTRMPLMVPGYTFELDNLIHDFASQGAHPEPTAVPRFMLELLRALLHNKPAATALFRSNPFQKGAPKFVRVMQYAYGFANSKEDGWYVRFPHTQLVPPLTLEHRTSHAEHAGAKHADKAHKSPAHVMQHLAASRHPATVLHVVHDMPPARNIRGVPLELADAFTQNTPPTDSLMLTRV